MFEWLRARLSEKQVQPTLKSEPVFSETENLQSVEGVSPLPSGILDYWHEVLIKDDLDGLQSADVRIPLSNPEQLARPGFDLGFGKYRRQALDFIVERDEQERRKSVEEESSENALASEVATADLTEPPSACPLPSEPDERRIPMALVFHVTEKAKMRVIWPQPRDEEGKGAEDKSADEKTPRLNIVFWFPFDLNADKEICLPRDERDCYPRIVRQWLDPQPLIAHQDMPAVIGYFETYRQALKAFFSEQGRTSDLERYVEGCFNLFARVQADGEDYPSSDLAGHWVTVPRTPSYATRALSRVYRALPRANSIGALEQLISPGRLRLPLRVDASASADVLFRHLAMVDKAAKPETPDEARSADPLNSSQRRALHALVGLGKNEGVIAVSGPPGTGKTAMLRAMIANQWVLAAYDQAEHCPVTVVCGATNQSVENVMGTFDGAVGDRHPLARRWLVSKGKRLLGFTASAPSKSKLEKHRDKFTVLEASEAALPIQGVGASCTYIKGNERAKAALEMARCFEGAFSSLETLFGVLFTAEHKTRVSDCTRQLARLRKVEEAAGDTAEDDVSLRRDILDLLGVLVEILGQGVRKAVDLQARVDISMSLEQLQSLLPSEGWSAERADSVSKRWCEAQDAPFRLAIREELLDVLWRPVIFQLAARYWEVRWLISAMEKGAPISRREALRRAAMLLPCMVATLHSAPRLLSEGQQPLFGFANLLIIDEAGQAAPELGVPILSLARQAVVVGDLKQLSPVSSLTPELELRQVLDRWGDEATLDTLCVRGADAATGSIMKLAATGASYAEARPDGTLRDGLLLREHYRCARSIIQLCIDLLYHDHDRDAQGMVLNRELVPMVDDPRPGFLGDGDLPTLDTDEEQALLARMKGSFPLPPLGFYQTGGPNDGPVKGDSWSNPGEVQAIVRWLKETGLPLARWAARAEGRAGEQVPLEKLVAIVTPFRGQAKAIRRAIGEQLDPHCEGLSDRLTIGTVHTLQGAEKPVVLFSAVNKDSRATRRLEDNHRQRVFIDRDDGRLLNVAISRAQKSFILFGHSELFFSQQVMNVGNDLPSAIVGRCLAGVDEPQRAQLTGVVRRPAHKLGPRALMVVESAHKAGIIQEFMPAYVQVFGCGGHIRELPGAGTIRWCDGLRPRWQLSQREGSDLQSALCNAATRLLQCDELVLGTDDDAQGEAIAWHILQVLQDAPWFLHVKRIRRIRFHALTQPALERAFHAGVSVPLVGETAQQRAASALRALNMGLAYGAIANRVLDNLIGSVYLHHGVVGGGRVKGPLLRALAGYGDSPGLPSKRHTLAIELKVDERTVPARLMVRRGKTGWLPWGSDRLEDAHRLLEHLPEAVIASEPCLLEVEERLLPAPEVLGTGLVLQEAFRRLGWLPSKTMKALQGLYELRSVDDEESPLSPFGEGWACEDAGGRLRLTALGRARAKSLLENPWLEGISSNALLYDFDQALNRFAEKTNASEQDYADFLGTWARRFDDRKEADTSPPIALPDSVTLDAEGNALALFSGQPEVPIGDWEPVSAAPPSCASGKGADEEPVPIAAGARTGAHGALVPLNIAIGADSPAMQAFSAHQRQLYDLMSKLTLASALRDGEAQVTRRVYPLAWPQMETHRQVEIGIEVTTVRPGHYRGWFDLDPEGLSRYTALWGDEDTERLLAGRAVLSLQPMADDALRTSSLPEPTVDRLLTWMETRGHGRPSTFATHVEGLLRSTRREKTGGEGND